MKPKKIIALLLALCMVMCMAACGGGDNASSTSSASSAGGESSLSSDAGSSEASEPESSEASTEGEPYRVRLTLPTMMTIPATEDIKFVEDTINNYIHDELGITDYEMELELASLTDYDTNVSMALASGEKYDIIIATNLNTYVTNGYMTDLTPYAENELAGALGVLPENWIRSGTVGGKIYAVPCYKGQVLSWKYIYDDAVYGDAVDWSAIKSLDDLDAAMPALKAAAPDQVPGVYNNQLVSLTAFEDHTSIVGQYAATVGDSTQLVNYFTTDAFKKGVEMAYKWSQAGYSDPEGSTNTLTYGIAYTSENPSAAAKMLSLIWTDEFVMSNLIYGVEGTSWEWNEDHSSIVYPEGLGIDTVPYTALYTCGAFGNQFNLYGMDGNTSEADKGFMKELLDGAWNPPLLGFIPNSEPVSTQVAAVSNVYDQYYKVLTYGDVNPDEFLPKFLEELETAGINDIIAEYQSQVDEWLKTI